MLNQALKQPPDGIQINFNSIVSPLPHATGAIPNPDLDGLVPSDGCSPITVDTHRSHANMPACFPLREPMRLNQWVILSTYVQAPRRKGAMHCMMQGACKSA